MSPAEAFSESNPVPDNISTIEELWEWHRPLIEAEEKWKKENEEKNNCAQQNLYVMRGSEQTERSVLLFRQNFVLTFLLDKFKAQKQSFGYRYCSIENYRFSIPHYP